MQPTLCYPPPPWSSPGGQQGDPWRGKRCRCWEQPGVSPLRVPQLPGCHTAPCTCSQSGDPVCSRAPRPHPVPRRLSVPVSPSRRAHPGGTLGGRLSRMGTSASGAHSSTTNLRTLHAFFTSAPSAAIPRPSPHPAPRSRFIPRERPSRWAAPPRSPPRPSPPRLAHRERPRAPLGRLPSPIPALYTAPISPRLPLLTISQPFFFCFFFLFFFLIKNKQTQPNKRSVARSGMEPWEIAEQQEAKPCLTQV